MIAKTPLHAAHLACGAKMVDFHGWEMPLHYGSQLNEHLYVRKDAGMFDVSHMTVIDIDGQDARSFLRKVLANDVSKLILPQQGLYTCMLNEQGGVIDDLIVYFIAENYYRLVVNASTRQKDWDWLSTQAKEFQVKLQLRDLAMIAVQGPQARAIVQTILPEQAQRISQLKPFGMMDDHDLFVARTGYTGEDGLELILPAGQAIFLWRALKNAGVHLCGLGARDTLRLEAGLNLYGTDMDETTTPLESNLAWTVAFEPSSREFIGRAALLKQKQEGPTRRLVGLILKDPGVLRSHQKVIVPNIGEGEVKSGTFSPTLSCSIALAHVPAAAMGQCFVEIRGKQCHAQIVKPPFVRYGKRILEV